MSEHWELEADLKANNKIPVQRWRSKRSKMTLTLAQVDGPVVNGYFCLATEAHDDDGLPHTLEHLIFLGSKEHPYKGVLDLLANRCLSSGTNAWTDTDHTCYTMTTAGSQGFLNLLPIYLEHILHPTLTEAGYLTEVHHVTGEGKDGGVVYCEMQGRENSGESLVHLAMLRGVYPGHCGYKSETGGIMKNLRESTNNKKVRDYHQQFYRPENLGLIVTGQVTAEEVFSALDHLDGVLMKEASEREPFLRPWQGEVPRLRLGEDILVDYPADEEDNGMVYVAWRGPTVVTNLYQMLAMMLLMEYLTETSVSPLQAAFVEVESPLASKVSYSVIENSESTVYLMFENVPLDKMPEVAPQLKKVLTDIVEKKLAWDTDRLEVVVNRRVLEQMSQVENSPHDAVAFMAIGDLLYGRNKEDLRVRLNSVDEFKRMIREPVSFWLDLIKNFFLDSPQIVVQGKPSMKLQQEMREKDEERVKIQKDQLGEDGLSNKQKELDKAMEENEKDAPSEVLTSVPIPGTKSIHFHPVQSVTTSTKEQMKNFDLKKMPVFFQFDQINSNFVYMFTVMDTDQVPQNLRPLLPLLLELLLESPLMVDGVETPYEEVVAQLSADCLESHIGLGSGGSRFLPGAYAQSAVLFLQGEPSKYQAMVSWINKLLYRTKLTIDRVRVVATKMENSVAELKRSGSKVVGVIMNSILMDEKSNLRSANMVRQQRFLRKLLSRLDCSPTEVLKELEELRALLTRPEGMLVHMATDLAILPGDPLQPWASLLPSHVPKKVVPLKVRPEQHLTLAPGAHLLTGLGSCESAYLSRSTPAIKDFNSPDLAPLMLALQYLTQLEGPMWRQIRGAGLAYGYSMYLSVNKGQLYIGLFKATHPVKAYVEAKRIVMDQVNGGQENWDQNLFESAKSSLIFELIEKEKSVGDVVQQSLLSSFKGTDREYNRKFLSLVDKASLADVARAAKIYLPPLFDPASSRTSLVVGPSDVEEVKTAFRELGVEIKLLESVDKMAD